MDTEDPRLVDCLWRAAIAKLRGAIRGEQDERHPPQGRLDGRRQEVRRGGPRRHKDPDRPPGRTRQSKSEETGGPLVEQDPDMKAGMGAHRQGERRGARPGQTTTSRMPARTSSSVNARRATRSVTPAAPGHSRGRR